MWKIFKKIKNNNPASSDLRLRLNTDMDYLGLDEDIQKGFLFFLGASMNVGFNKAEIDLSKYNKNESEYLKNLEKTIDAYSKSTGDFSDYGQLNDNVFTSYIYSINFVLSNILAKLNVDDHLRKVELPGGGEPIVIGKTKLIESFIEPYTNCTDSEFKLKDYHNLIELFFKKIGQHLTETGFDNCKSYEAGYAYFCMQSHFDIKGITYMLETIVRFLTPIYMALYNYPILHLFYPKELDSNHIFSSTLQMLYAGLDPNIVQPIHRFHQHIFYSSFEWKFSLEKISSNFSWKFNLENDKKFRDGILINSRRIIEMQDIVDYKQPIIDSGQIFKKELINSKTPTFNFYVFMVKVVLEKYHYAPIKREGEPIWNNLGDMLQYFAILFYEGSLHAIVVEDFTEKK